MALALVPLEECLSRNEKWINTYADREGQGQGQGQGQGVGEGQGFSVMQGQGQGLSQGLSLGQGVGQEQGLGLGWVASVLYGSTDSDFYPSYVDNDDDTLGGAASRPGLGLGSAHGPGLGLGLGSAHGPGLDQTGEVGVEYLSEGYTNNSSCHQVTPLLSVIRYCHPTFLLLISFF